MGKRLLVWFVILPVLGAFSVTIIGGALAARKNVAVAGTKIVPPDATRASGVLVAEGRATGRFSVFKSWFGVPDETRLCWVTQGTAAMIAARFPSRQRSVKVNDRGIFTMLVVYPAWAKTLREVLGASQVKCTLVATAQRAFFLPFDVNLS